MKNKKNILIIGAVGLVVLFCLLAIFFMRGNSSKTTQTTDQTVVNLEETPIPTIDSSVSVELTQPEGSKDVLLELSGIPMGTESVEYELSYSTLKQGLQGIVGTIQTEGKSDFSKKLTLGTCSSGTCIYHDVEGSIKVSLRFMGSYGERLFDKEYSL